MPWRNEYYQLLDDCEARESQLTDWERNFIDSLRNRLDKEDSLTPKQIETLDTIWERVTAKG
jgi:hypothetical protein